MGCSAKGFSEDPGELPTTQTSNGTIERPTMHARVSFERTDPLRNSRVAIAAPATIPMPAYRTTQATAKATTSAASQNHDDRRSLSMSRMRHSTASRTKATNTPSLATLTCSSSTSVAPKTTRAATTGNHIGTGRTEATMRATTHIHTAIAAAFISRDALNSDIRKTQWNTASRIEYPGGKK